MIHTNLTPFQFGAKVTSRVPPQLEATLFARGTWAIAPGQPPQVIEDFLEQGSMTGDVLDPEDLERAGALEYASDFADFKPKADLLLKGTCHPPRGQPVQESVVRFQVGSWSKSLIVIGSRVRKPGLLFGESVGEALPFARMPLTYANAYGGPDYPQNPAGQGHAKSPVMPTVEPFDPQQRGKKAPGPAGYMPLNPAWPQRARKLGKQYGLEYLKTRFPFYAADMDWTYWNAAPEDQQLDGYLRGDEDLAFQHLHPEQPLWSTRLPGVRVRAFVKDDQEVLREVPMHLDTLYVDHDAGRLHLTWRGLTPAREFDLSDLAVALIASEALDTQPLGQDHYRALLEEFQGDPVGLKKKMPPGFMEMGETLEAEEAAELAADPLPTGPIERDPMGIRARVMAAFPPGFLAAAAAAEAGELPEGPNPLLAGMALPLALAGEAMPAETKQKILDGMQQAWEGLPEAEQAKILEEAAKPTPPPAPPPPPPTPPEKVAELRAQAAALEARHKALVDQGVDSPLLGLFALGQRMIARWTDPPPAVPKAGRGLEWIAEQLGKSKQALEEAEIPAEQKAEALEKLAEQEAGLAQVMAAFPAPPPVPGSTPDGPDYSGQDLRGQDFAGQDLRRANFSRAILTDANFSSAQLDGASFAGALLNRASLENAALVGAVLAGADLTRARASGARLAGANLRGADLKRSQWVQADLRGADLRGCDLTQATLRTAFMGEANLEGANLTQARFEGARLDGANLTEAILTEAVGELASLRGANLTSAQLQRARFMDVRLNGADLSFTQLDKADLRKADLSGANLSMATGQWLRADQLNLSGATLDMTNLSKSRFRGASLRRAKGQLARMTHSDFSGADFREAQLGTCAFDESTLDDANLRQADLTKASLRGVKAQRAVFVGATLQQAAISEGADLGGARLMRIVAPGSVWSGTRLTDADFSYAELGASHFQNTRGDRVSFYAANLKGAFLRKAELVDPGFVSADLCQADMTFTTLVKAQFQQANCYGTKFLSAQLASCDFTQTNLHTALFDEGQRP